MSLLWRTAIQQPSVQHVPVRDLMGYYSAEFDSPVHGVRDDLVQSRLERDSWQMRAGHEPPPVHVNLPAPDDEDRRPTLMDGHHRVHAADRAGRETLPVIFHRPVEVRPGEYDYPTWLAEVDERYR